MTPRLLAFLLSCAVCSDVLGAQASIGVFTTDTDVGRSRGSATYDPRDQTYQVAGAGQNMWGPRDDFHFVWKRISGNFILATRARFLGKGVEEHRKIGWTIRPTLASNGVHVTAALHGNGLMSLQYRRTIGGVTEEQKSRDSLPDADAVIQLERRDGVYILSVARFGDTLVAQQLTGVSLPDTVYVGLFVCAHNDTVVERAVFRDVQIRQPAAWQPAPGHTQLPRARQGSDLGPLTKSLLSRLVYARHPGSDGPVSTRRRR
jgi:TolB protein